MEGNVANGRIVRRHAFSVAPAIVVTLVANVVVEGSAVITDVRRSDGQIFNGAGLGFDGVGVRNRQRPSQAFRAIGARPGTGREVKSIDVVGAVLFDDSDDA